MKSEKQIKKEIKLLKIQLKNVTTGSIMNNIIRGLINSDIQRLEWVLKDE